MTLRTKILLPFVLIGLVLLLFLYGYWMPRYVADLKHQYRQATERHLVSVIEGLIPLLLAHQLDAVYENLDTLKERNINWQSIRLIDAAGRTVYPLGPVIPQPTDHDVRIMEQPILQNGVDLGRLVVAVDFDEPLVELRHRYRQLLAIACVIIVLAIGSIWFIIERMVSRPVTRLAQASKRLAEGDFTSPLPPGGQDEVSELVRNFDHMRSSIRGYQAELIRRNEALIKLSHAIEQSPVSIVITDQAGLIEFINSRFSAVMGFDAGEVLGRHIRLVKAVDGAEPPFDAIWTEVRSGKIWRGEFQSTRKNGEVFWQSVSLSPVLSDSDEIVHVVAVLEDISERRALEEQLRQAQKMEAVGMLTGGIAHDFNNILAAVIGYGSIVRMKLAQDDALRSPVEEILHAAERAAALIRSLLAFSRKQIANPRPVQVGELISRIRNMLLRLIREDIELRTVVPSEDLTIRIDPGQLEQILFNLVTNARDAMPNGGTLIIEAEQTMLSEQFQKRHGEQAEGPHAVISVSDTGTGMDVQTQARMYEPFFTTKEQGKGTGLGLAMVYGIVKQNNGQITCYSVPGKGTTFKIYLPLIETTVTTVAAVPLPELQTGSETILVAEDDDSVREYAQTVLQEAGYTVLAAENGAEALEKFKQQPERIDLLLLDVIMPKKNGREVYEDIRTVWPKVKVLFTSGYTADLLEQKGIVAGGFAVISKPSTPHDLLRKVREVLDSPVEATNR